MNTRYIIGDFRIPAVTCTEKDNETHYDQNNTQQVNAYKVTQKLTPNRRKIDLVEKKRRKHSRKSTTEHSWAARQG